MGLDFRRVFVQVHEGPDVHRGDQDPAAALAARASCVRQGPDDHLDHHGQSVPLVAELQAAEGQHGHLVRLGVVSAPVVHVAALLVDQPAVRHGLAALDLLFHLAARDHAEGHVQHERRPLCAGHGEGDGLGPQAPVGAAVGRHEFAAAVQAHHADHAVFGDPRGEIAQPADVGDVPQGHHPDRRVARLLHREGEGLRHRHDAVGAVPVDLGEAGTVRDHGVVFPEPVIGLERRDVAGHEPHAVGVVPQQVAGRQVIGENMGVLFGDAGRLEDRAAQAIERFVRYYGHGPAPVIFSDQ